MRDAVCLSLERLAEAVEKAKATLALEKSFRRVPAGLCGGDGLASFAKCVREGMCVNGVLFSTRDLRMVLLKARLTSGGFCHSLNDYDRFLNVIEISSV